MGHGFRFSLDKRYILNKSQMDFCQVEEPYQECYRRCFYGPLTRLFCMLWDIFNLDIDFMDKERKKQKKLDDFQ